MRILVIEDDAALASYLRKGLQSEHYSVDVALDGEQGALWHPTLTMTSLYSI